MTLAFARRPRNSTAARTGLLFLAIALVLCDIAIRNVHTALYFHQHVALVPTTDNAAENDEKKSNFRSLVPYGLPMIGTPLTVPARSTDSSVLPSQPSLQIAKPYVCGQPWKDFLDGLTFDGSNSSSPLLWTVSGGDEYRQYVGILLDHWSQRLEPDLPLLVVALDEKTAQHVCHLGYTAVHWEAHVQSYSRVADAKFQASAEWAARGIDALFVELDVFCRRSPVPLVLDYIDRAQNNDNATVDILKIGHGDVQGQVNLGVYFVKASTRTAEFFLSLTRLLEPSLTVNSYVNGNGTRFSFFDQSAFAACLHYKAGQGWWLLPDENHANYSTTEDNNLLRRHCEAHQGLKSVMVSNLHISSQRPPTVVDTTYCIHPLGARPFTSFKTKLATAKFLGFDPTVIAEDERLLKTMSGDITPSENWEHGFFSDELHAYEDAQQKFQTYVATLVYLAKATRRTLVLPRHVRDKRTHAYPVFSLVNTASIGEMVPWRFMSQAEAIALEEQGQTRLVEMSDNLTSSAIDDVAQDCATAKVCAIQGLTKATAAAFQRQHSDLANNTTTVHQNSDLADIISNLTWCFDFHGIKERVELEHLDFVESVGSFAPACVPKELSRKGNRRKTNIVTPFLGT